MIQWLCINYGKKIGNFNSQDEYSFPTLDALVKDQKEVSFTAKQQMLCFLFQNY